MNSNTVPNFMSLEIMRTSASCLYACGHKVRFLTFQTSLVLLLGLALPAVSVAAGTTKVFASPDEAVAALKVATASADTNALRAILGPASEDLQNPDRIQATNELETFSAALASTNHLVHVSDTRVVLEVGDDLWPFPVPLVKAAGGWCSSKFVSRGSR